MTLTNCAAEHKQSIFGQNYDLVFPPSPPEPTRGDDDDDDEDSTIFFVFLLEICPLKDLMDLRMHFLEKFSSSVSSG